MPYLQSKQALIYFKKRHKVIPETSVNITSLGVSLTQPILVQYSISIPSETLEKLVF